MKRFSIAVAFLAVLLAASTASAATAYADITTDKSNYAVGEKVHWTVWAWSSSPVNEPPNSSTFPDNHGIALLNMRINDDQGEAMEAADTTEVSEDKFELTNTYYSRARGFILESAGTPTGTTPKFPNPGGLFDILVQQNPDTLDEDWLPIVYDVGNDGTPHIFAQGSYTATVAGTHRLTATLLTTYANYWPSHDAPLQNPVAFEVVFEQAQGNHVDFEVGLAPTADAGADTYRYEGNTCNLNGSNSTNVTTYSWQQTGGKTVTLLNADTATPSFVAPTMDTETAVTPEVDTTADAQLAFKLTVTNQFGSAEDTVNVRVYLSGDADKNDKVNTDDFLIWRYENLQPTHGTSADFNAQNGVNTDDFLIWRFNNNRKLATP